jgi:hypothetical protein
MLDMSVQLSNALNERDHPIRYWNSPINAVATEAQWMKIFLVASPCGAARAARAARV